MSHPEPGPRVLALDLSERLGGASIRILNLLESLPAGQAAIATLDQSEVAQRARLRGVPQIGVGNRKSDPRVAGRVARALREGSYQVLDTQNPQSKLWGTLAAYQTGVALVSTLNSYYIAEHEGRARGHAYQWIERLSAPRTDLFIAVSAAIESALLSDKVPTERLALIPNAVTLNAGEFASPPGWLAQEFDLPADSQVLCAVGRLVEAKGYSHLLDALSLLPAHYCCVIVGEGHLRPALEAQIESLGLGKRVRLAGLRPREEGLKIAAAAAAFTMPSRTEGTPVALLEAAALGKPIVASAVGGIPELLADGREAWLVPPGEAQPLADALRSAVESAAEAARRGAAAQARVQAHFSLEAQRNATLAAYSRALDRRKPR